MKQGFLSAVVGGWVLVLSGTGHAQSGALDNRLGGALLQPRKLDNRLGGVSKDRVQDSQPVPPRGGEASDVPRTVSRPTLPSTGR